MRVVLKIIKMRHTGSARNLLRHFRESILLQYLQGNPYVVNELGHCFDEKTNEFVLIAPYYGSNLEKLVLNGTTRSKTLKEILQWSWDIAKGVEAMHNVEGGPFVHADIQPRQFLISDDGRVLLNDFNRGKFLPWKW